MHSNSLLLLGLAPANALGAILYATHYSGTLSVLSLSDNSLTVVSSEENCGPAPSWVTFDSANQVLYCVDELNQGGSLNAFDTDAEGGLTPIASAKLLGNPVHSALYGGEDGVSFLTFCLFSSLRPYTVFASSDQFLRRHDLLIRCISGECRPTLEFDTSSVYLSLSYRESGIHVCTLRIAQDN